MPRSQDQNRLTIRLKNLELSAAGKIGVIALVVIVIVALCVMSPRVWDTLAWCWSLLS